MDDVKKEDLSGQLSTISKANSSTCGSITAASVQPQPLAPQASSTLPLHNAIVDVSPVEDNCDEETLKTLRVPSDNRASHITSNGSYEAVTKEHLAVRIDDQSDVPRRFQLTRSPTISFGDSGESP